MAAAPRKTSVGVLHQPTIELRRENAVDGVVDHPIAYRSGGDEPPLGPMEQPQAVSAGTVRAGGELALEGEDLTIGVELEGVDRRAVAFAAAKVEPCRPQILGRGDG